MCAILRNFDPKNHENFKQLLGLRRWSGAQGGRKPIASCQRKILSRHFLRKFFCDKNHFLISVLFIRIYNEITGYRLGCGAKGGLFSDLSCWNTAILEETGQVNLPTPLSGIGLICVCVSVCISYCVYSFFRIFRVWISHFLREFCVLPASRAGALQRFLPPWK